MPLFESRPVFAPSPRAQNPRPARSRSRKGGLASGQRLARIRACGNSGHLGREAGGVPPTSNTGGMLVIGGCARVGRTGS